jgi:hypothetical protein
VTLNERGDAISLSYTPLVSPLAPSCAEIVAHELKQEGLEFDSRISYETATPGMVIPPILPTTKPQPGLKFFPRSQTAPAIPGVNQEGAEERQSFLRKYWYIILPLVIMSFLGGEEPQQQQTGAGGEGGQGQQGAASPGRQPAVAPAQQPAVEGGNGAPKSRRGKRG